MSFEMLAKDGQRLSMFNDAGDDVCVHLVADAAVWLSGHTQHSISFAAHSTGCRWWRQHWYSFILFQEETGKT